MRRAKTESIDILIDKVLKNIYRKGDNYYLLIIDEWKQMLGTTVATATRRIYIKDHKLFVYLNSPAVKQEIVHLKSKILEHLNQKFPQGELQDIILK